MTCKKNSPSKNAMLRPVWRKSIRSKNAIFTIIRRTLLVFCETADELQRRYARFLLLAFLLCVYLTSLVLTLHWHYISENTEFLFRFTVEFPFFRKFFFRRKPKKNLEFSPKKPKKPKKSKYPLISQLFLRKTLKYGHRLQNTSQ